MAAGNEACAALMARAKCVNSSPLHDFFCSLTNLLFPDYLFWSRSCLLVSSLMTWRGEQKEVAAGNEARAALVARVKRATSSPMHEADAEIASLRRQVASVRPPQKCEAVPLHRRQAT